MNCYHCTPATGGLYVCDSCKGKFRNGSLRAYDDEYTGPRFRYGYINRPFAIAHQPKGFVLCSYQPMARVEMDGKRARHGVIDYPFMLSEDEMYSFEMFFVGVC